MKIYSFQVSFRSQFDDFEDLPHGPQLIEIKKMISGHIQPSPYVVHWYLRKFIILGPLSVKLIKNTCHMHDPPSSSVLSNYDEYGKHITHSYQGIALGYDQTPRKNSQKLGSSQKSDILHHTNTTGSHSMRHPNPTML